MSTHRIFGHVAEVLQAAQRTAIEVENAPDKRKRLRHFSVQEAASLMGLTPRQLRQAAKLESSGKGITPRARMSFQEFLAARQAAALKLKRPDLWPKRGADEPMASIVFTNFKGGSAKTTTSVHFAQYLALAGYHVLFVDLDSQGSATAQFGLDPVHEVQGKDCFTAWLQRPTPKAPELLQRLCRRTYWPSIDLLPAGPALGEAEDILSSRAASGKAEETLYFDELAALREQLQERYDVMVVDTRPDVNMLMTTALHAATGLVIPTRATMTDLASTGAFFSHLAGYTADFEAAFGQSLGFGFSRILLTDFDPADRSQEALAALLRDRFGDLVLPGAFLHSRVVGTAGFGKETLYEYEPSTDRAAYNRVLASVNGVNQALVEQMRLDWGRSMEKGSA
jgi:chromosome partitioning protein